MTMAYWGRVPALEAPLPQGAYIFDGKVSNPDGSVALVTLLVQVDGYQVTWPGRAPWHYHGKFTRVETWGEATR